MPAPLISTEAAREPLEVLPVMDRGVRAALVGIALALTGVFGLAAWLNPYDASGQPRRMGTHRQIGLPPCTFHEVTGYPCPSCGMTTSFALLAHGDVTNSLRANAVGTLLAGFCLVCIPWSLASVACRRVLFIGSLERALLWTVLTFLVLLLTRWAVVLGLIYSTR